MKICIVGICGTFMAGIATLAKQLGHQVYGCDQHVYPPMSTYLQQQGINIEDGYQVPADFFNQADHIVIGNVMARGNPAVEYILNHQLPYTSGPQWLATNILPQHQVIAVAGTHGKTTTSSMIAWIIQSCLSKQQTGVEVGFLIGGIPQNFNLSARVGNSPYFVIEADEYDSAFFDKRSKFVHYQPKICVLNNLEFDHADIFNDITEIEKQFHHLVRTVPGNGAIIYNDDCTHLKQVLAMGCWSKTISFNSQKQWYGKKMKSDASHFSVYKNNKSLGEVSWSLIGDHNLSNALAAIAATDQLNIPINISLAALQQFNSVKRRMDIVGSVNDITIYDDFAHHPTAISETLGGLRKKVGQAKIIAILELASYTMRNQVHNQARLKQSLSAADQVLIKSTDLSTDTIIKQVAAQAQPGDYIVIMSNQGFDNIHQRLIEVLKNEQ